MLSVSTPPLDAPPVRRVHVAWQAWFDGAIVRAPLALADGAIVVVDHGSSSSVRRFDESGGIRWEVALDGVASGDPARSQGLVAVPCDGRRVVVLGLEDGQRVGLPIALPGLVLRGPIAAFRGHVLARFAGPDDVAEPFLVIAGTEAAREGAPAGLVLHLQPDPLGDAIESRFRATNHAFILAGEDPSGFATLAAIDQTTFERLWRERVGGCGLTYLWAAGGLVDAVFTDRVTSFSARSGTRLSTRFEGMVLDAARIAGETLLIVLGAQGPAAERTLMAFDVATEDPVGQMVGFERLVGAGSDECLLADAHDRPLLLELPSLLPVPIRDGQSIVAPRRVAWSRHRAWIVGHDGKSLSAVDLS